MSPLPEGTGWDLQVKPKAKPTPEAPPPSADGTEVTITPKKTAKPASNAPGGVEELPGSPRPKPKKDEAAPSADPARQKPGSLEEDAEVWVDPRKGGKGWTTPSGYVAPEPGADATATEPGAQVEEDEDTEVIVTPRRQAPPEPRSSRRPAAAKEGKEGRDFEEYNRVTAQPQAPAAEPFLFTARAPPQPATQPGVSLPGAPAAAPSWATQNGTGWNVAPHLQTPRPTAGPSGHPPGAQGVAVSGLAASSSPGLASGTSHQSSLDPAGRGAAPPSSGPQPSPANAAPMPGPAGAAGPRAPLPNPPLRRSGGPLNVLVIGSGAREHAICSALLRTKRCQVFAVPRHRNPGIVKTATGFRILPETDVQGIVAWAKTQKADLAVVGPESALEAGVADALRAAGIPVASPSQAAARIETSKTFMRQLMQRHGLGGQLGFHAFDDLDQALAFLDRNGPLWAIKPVGLTGGKGVQVYGDHFHDVDGAKAYVRSVFTGHVGGGALQFEELAVGEEFTLMAFTDGANLVPMPAVQDHKRLLEGDQGPNTGGMGAYSQSDGLLPFLTPADYGEAVVILQGIVHALAREGTPYCGTIYGQFMLTAQGPKVIEVNARFGDPEAMNVLHILDSDYLAILEAMASGTLSHALVRFRPRATVVKYVVPKGYGEGAVTPGRHIEVDDFNVRRSGGTVYYASIEQQPMGPFATMTSRTLAILGEGATIQEAEMVCSKALTHIHGQGLYVRHDIGTQALLERRVQHMAAVRAGSPIAAR